MAKVSLTPEAAKQLDELPIVPHGRVLKLLERLENAPR